MCIRDRFAHGQRALFDFRGMMCIVAQEDYPVVLYLEVEMCIRDRAESVCIVTTDFSS